jgi:hypothetical protein
VIALGQSQTSPFKRGVTVAVEGRAVFRSLWPAALKKCNLVAEKQFSAKKMMSQKVGSV